MVSLILLFTVTLSVIMLASYHEIRRQSSEMLERYADLYSLDQQPKTEMAPDLRPDSQDLPGPAPEQGNLPPDLGPGFQLSTFYSVAFSEEGAVLSVNDGGNGLYSKDELIRIARDLLAKDKTAGRLDSLSYTISSKQGYTLVAFIDDTMTESSMRTLLHNVLIIGGASIIILFFLSLFLSGQIIRPLEENDKKQKQFISTPMETVDLSRVVTGEMLAFESVAFDQGKTIQSDIDEGIRVMGNQAQLTQLASILLDNAVRHGAGNKIELTCKRQGRSAVLSAVNDGDEIPAEKLEHLFDRFYRVDEARSNEGHHYGLGLSIAKAVAEKHGGNIAVSCRDGKIRFTVSIPEKKIIQE